MIPSTLASAHLNSKVVFAEFLKLVTRPQYTLGERGEITEQTPILKACRIEETNEHRLALAEKVLNVAAQCLEFEVSVELANRKEKAAVKAFKAGARTVGGSKPAEGGYA